LAPAVCLAKTGYESQQTDEPAPPDRRDNLFAPLPGDYGAHERFDERAKGHSVQFWLNRHRSLVALIGGGLTDLSIGALNRRGTWRGHGWNGYRSRLSSKADWPAPWPHPCGKSARFSDRGCSVTYRHWEFYSRTFARHCNGDAN
jgi:hypothetical protein